MEEKWVGELGQLLSARTCWSPNTVAAMVPQTPRPSGLFGLRRSSLTARSLRLPAPRFSNWAVDSPEDDPDFLLDAQILRKKNRLGEKGMSTRYRSTMDCSIVLRPDSEAITSRWDIVGDGWPEYDF